MIFSFSSLRMLQVIYAIVPCGARSFFAFSISFICNAVNSATFFSVILHRASALRASVPLLVHGASMMIKSKRSSVVSVSPEDIVVVASTLYFFRFSFINAIFVSETSLRKSFASGKISCASKAFPPGAAHRSSIVVGGLMALQASVINVAGVLFWI